MRFAVILALACQPYFAVSFLYGAVPVVLRQNGASLETIGLFGLVFFAFTVNFLWAPAIDRLSPRGYGRRRFWLFLTQALSITFLLLLALLDPAAQSTGILAAGMVLAGLAATQRSAILGYCAEALGDGEKAWGATAFGWGTALGNIVGGALGLAMIERMGWSAAILMLAGGMALITVPLLRIDEPAPVPRSRHAALTVATDVQTWLVIAALTPATFGLAVAFAMTQPRLIDLGFTLTSIGIVAAIGNLIAATLAGPATGWFASRFPLGVVIAGGATAIAVTFVVLMLFDRVSGDWLGALAAVIVVFSAICALGVASNTLFLRVAGKRDAAATDVTFFSAIMSLVALAGFMASGFIASAAGYVSTLGIAAAGALLTAMAAALLWSRMAALGLEAPR